MNGRTAGSAVLLFAIAALLFAAGVSAAETVVKVEPFLLVPPEGPTAVVPFEIRQPGTVVLEISTTQPVPMIGVVVRGAGVQAAPFRKDGRTPLRMEFKVTGQDLERGNRWYAFPTLVAPNRKIYAVPGGMAAGSVKVSFVPAQAGPVATRQVPPPGKAMTTTPPVTLAVPPPPSRLKLPPGGKLPPPGTATPPLPGGGSVPPPPASGRYRVTINGISVQHATWDTMLQTDGKGDEIFVMVDISELYAGGAKVGSTRTIKSLVYGDTNGFPGRLAAGSLSPKGGIRTGDNIPNGPGPWMRSGFPLLVELPLLVWQGELVDGQNGVLIVPAIWEQDSKDALAAVYNKAAEVYGSTLRPIWDVVSSGFLDPNAYNRVIFGLGGYSPITSRLNALLDRLFWGGNLNPIDLIYNWLGATVTNVVGESKDRPIGMIESGGKYLFDPYVIILNYRIAELALVPDVRQRAPGIIELRYVDAPRLGGDYTLYMQVEKIQ